MSRSREGTWLTTRSPIRTTPSRDLLEPGDHPQGGRLPAARRADEDHELAVLDPEAHVRDGARAVRVDLGDLIEGHARHDDPPFPVNGASLPSETICDGNERLDSGAVEHPHHRHPRRRRDRTGAPRGGDSRARARRRRPRSRASAVRPFARDAPQDGKPGRPRRRRCDPRAWARAQGSDCHPGGQGRRRQPEPHPPRGDRRPRDRPHRTADSRGRPDRRCLLSHLRRPHGRRRRLWSEGVARG